MFTNLFFLTFFIWIVDCTYAQPIQNSSFASCENFSISELDLDEAVFRALNQSYNLRLADNEIGSKQSSVKQARLHPNPELSYDVENFAGKHHWKGWKGREERYVYSQLIETAGKRRLRTQAASYQYYASLVEYDVTALILLNRLNRMFIQVVAAQELLKLTNDQATIAKEVLRIATRKVEAGKVGPIQQKKAEVAYSSVKIAINKAETELKNAKKRLSLIWSNPCPDFDRVIFPFFTITEPIPFEKCLANLCNQSEILQLFYDHLNTKKLWELEKAKRVPDVTIQYGYKANYEENNQGHILSVSIPIPVFNRNQGNIGQSYYEMQKLENRKKQLWIILESRLAIAYEELNQAYNETERIQTITLPLATESFELAQKGYQEGKFEYLDVLDAQRTLFEIREKYIQSLVNYHTRQADIDYLNSQMD